MTPIESFKNSCYSYISYRSLQALHFYVRILKDYLSYTQYTTVTEDYLTHVADTDASWRAPPRRGSRGRARRRPPSTRARAARGRQPRGRWLRGRSMTPSAPLAAHRLLALWSGIIKVLISSKKELRLTTTLSQYEPGMSFRGFPW